MPGDPNQCREHAAHCRQFAANAPNELVAENFSNLALTWERLAAELESTEPSWAPCTNWPRMILLATMDAATHPQDVRRFSSV
jgi:hypothetical protein